MKQIRKATKVISPCGSARVFASSCGSQNYTSSFEIPPRLEQLWDRIKDWEETKAGYIYFDASIMGVAVNMPIFKEDIRQFCVMQDIGSSAITIYLRYDLQTLLY